MCACAYVGVVCGCVQGAAGNTYHVCFTLGENIVSPVKIQCHGDIGFSGFVRTAGKWCSTIGLIPVTQYPYMV